MEAQQESKRQELAEFAQSYLISPATYLSVFLLVMGILGSTGYFVDSNQEIARGLMQLHVLLPILGVTVVNFFWFNFSIEPFGPFDIVQMRNLVIAGLCREMRLHNRETFHKADMIWSNARGYLEKHGITEYELSGDDAHYTPVLDAVYGPLAKKGFIKE